MQEGFFCEFKTNFTMQLFKQLFTVLLVAMLAFSCGPHAPEGEGTENTTTTTEDTSGTDDRSNSGFGTLDDEEEERPEEMDKTPTNPNLRDLGDREEEEGGNGSATDKIVQRSQNNGQGISIDALAAEHAVGLQFYASSTMDGADDHGIKHGVREHCDILKVEALDDGEVFFLLLWDNPRGLRETQQFASDNYTEYRTQNSEFAQIAPSTSAIKNKSFKKGALQASWTDIKKHYRVIKHSD